MEKKGSELWVCITQFWEKSENFEMQINYFLCFKSVAETRFHINILYKIAFKNTKTA